MENVKIDVSNYEARGFGDIYYGLLTFISNYAKENFDIIESFKSDNSQYAIAVTTMKGALKEILDYFNKTDAVFIPSLGRNVKLDTLTFEEQMALEERCKEYLVLKLNRVLNNNLESKVSNRIR